MVRSIRTILAAFVISVLVFTGTDKALAIADPDSMSVQVAAFQNLAESGDMLFAVPYVLFYSSPPTERASQAFLGRLFDGTDELISTVPYAYVNGGYDLGLMSVYFTAAEVTNLGITWEDPAYEFRIQGNPNVFATPPIVTSPSIVWTTSLFSGSSALATYLFAAAIILEANWDAYTDPDIILTAVVGDAKVLTAEGEDYFQNVIPSLRQLAPKLFSSKTSAPVIIDREVSLTYRDQLLTFWDDTSIGRAREGIANLLGMPAMLLSSLFLVGFIVFLGWVAMKTTGSFELTPLIAAVVFPVGAFIGMTDIIFAGLIAAAAVFGTAFILYFRRG